MEKKYILYKDTRCGLYWCDDVEILCQKNPDGQTIERDAFVADEETLLNMEKKANLINSGGHYQPAQTGHHTKDKRDDQRLRIGFCGNFKTIKTTDNLYLSCLLFGISEDVATRLVNMEFPYRSIESSYFKDSPKDVRFNALAFDNHVPPECELPLFTPVFGGEKQCGLLNDFINNADEMRNIEFNKAYDDNCEYLHFFNMEKDMDSKEKLEKLLSKLGVGNEVLNDFDSFLSKIQLEKEEDDKKKKEDLEKEEEEKKKKEDMEKEEEDDKKKKEDLEKEEEEKEKAKKKLEEKEGVVVKNSKEVLSKAIELSKVFTNSDTALKMAETLSMSEIKDLVKQQEAKNKISVGFNANADDINNGYNEKQVAYLKLCKVNKLEPIKKELEILL